MSSLSFLLLAGFGLLMTGCPRAVESSANAAPAARPVQQVPNDSGVLNDALVVRDATVRDATAVRLDSGTGRDAAGPRGPL